MPDPAKPYALKSDASDYAVSAVLEQEGRPLGFLRKKMSPAEIRNATYDQELLALNRALEKWRRLLLTADVTAFTDQRAIQYLLKLNADKPIRGRIASWLIFLSDFQNLKIAFQPGSGNIVADALSRCPIYELAMNENGDQEPQDKTGSEPMKINVSRDLLVPL